MKVFIYECFPLGHMAIGEQNNAISHILFSDREDLTRILPSGYIMEETSLIQQAKKQLYEYLNGVRIDFDLPLLPEGTVFQKKVWDALLEIPYGETRSYKEIGERIGSPKGSRAVGLANNRNPISIMIPCHRVIGSNGKLVGYGGGLENKEKLLTLEKRNCQK